jgi:hypothetical protein
MTWTITIPLSIPSRNERARQHHWQIKDWRSGFASFLKAAKKQQRIPDATGKRRVTITRLLGKGQKFFDDDNLDAKTLIDAMKPEHIHTYKRKGITKTALIPGAALIVDDSKRWIELAPIGQERSADGDTGTRIELEDVDGP